MLLKPLSLSSKLRSVCFSQSKVLLFRLLLEILILMWVKTFAWFLLLMKRMLINIFILFERVTSTLKWPKNVWTLLLLCVLSGKAQRIY